MTELRHPIGSAVVEQGRARERELLRSFHRRADVDETMSRLQAIGPRLLARPKMGSLHSSRSSVGAPCAGARIALTWTTAPIPT